MEIVRAIKFDQAVDDIPAGHMLDVSNLTFKGSEEHFDTGKACAPFVSTGATCNYIEDFHKVQMDRREFKMGDNTVYFDVEIRVEYGNNAMERSNQREIHKRITVSIQDYWPGGKQFLNQPIELSRVIRSEEHTSELQSRGHLVCSVLLEKKQKIRSLHST